MIKNLYIYKKVKKKKHWKTQLFFIIATNFDETSMAKIGSN